MKRSTKSEKSLAGNLIEADFQSEISSRFLSYALSTIISRAIPDIRDGLKPVHRRIIYAMQRMHLQSDKRFRKSAAVVGDVIGKFHPHGDQPVYDAMVRMSQDFSMRYPLVDGQGNFGNVDGDPAAAMRYTEVKLTKLANELLEELDLETVAFRENYDRTTKEPVLLPSKVPNLFINGTTGIAVGLATSFPPHNIAEIIDGIIFLIDNEKAETSDLIKFVKGPDFPTYGKIVTTKKELIDIYESGRGSLRVESEWTIEKNQKGKTLIVINSIPYSVNKSRLIEKIGTLILTKKMPDLVDIKDESTEDIRIVLEPKSENLDIEMIVGYLMKNSELMINYQINMTALTKDLTPKQHSLKEGLKAFMEFRKETINKRVTFEIGKLSDRLHILDGFIKIYIDLDQVIAIIRKSKTRDDAKNGLMKTFELDTIQADAILDLRLGSIVGLEISKIKNEHKEKSDKIKRLKKIVSSKEQISKYLKEELLDIKKEYQDKRRTKITYSKSDLVDLAPSEYIADEDNYVVVSAQGMIKRVKSAKSRFTMKFKEGDSMISWMFLNSKEKVLIFTSLGKLYSLKVSSIPQTTGFGVPLQSFFKFDDGERIVAIKGVVTDEKKKDPELSSKEVNPELELGAKDFIKEDDLISIATQNGLGFSLKADKLDATTKNGKRIVNLKGDDILICVLKNSKPYMVALTNDGYIIKFKTDQLPVLSGAGSGVKLVSLKKTAHIISMRNLANSDSVTIIQKKGKDIKLKVSSIELKERAKAGTKVTPSKGEVIGMIV